MSEEIKIHRGLTGIYFDRTQSSLIDGKAGKLLYRGYSIHDLAQSSTFEETAYLLLHGDLPTSVQLAQLESALQKGRELPQPIYTLIEVMRAAHPMEVLRTAVSALGGWTSEVNDNSAAAILQKGIQLISQVPMIVAAHHRLRLNKEPVSPDPTLGHAAHFIYLLSGQKPSDETAKLLDIDFILHAEHGSNASAFVARVVTGTGANLHAALTAAMGALSGPAHGGAAENVMLMAKAIGEPANAKTYIEQLRKNREPVMGFGHRVYRTEDPRARHLRDGVKRLSLEMNEPPQWYAILEAVVEAMKPYAQHGVNVNVDFYAGVIYHLLNIPDDLFVPIFAMGRMPGWIIHVLEQLEHNILLRPLLKYTGPDELQYIPINQR
jgi:citrate synthase